MNESGNQKRLVPLSHVPGGGTAGQGVSGGTTLGTSMGQTSLKALARAKIGGTSRGTNVGQAEKSCPTASTPRGTKYGDEFERNRQTSVGQNPAPSPVGDATDAAPDFSPEWLPPPAPPLQCFACSCWQKVPGLAWPCGRCAVTGRKINMQSRCDRGFEEWQASPLPERTAPQPGARRAHCD